MNITVDGDVIVLTDDGYLQDMRQWNKAVAIALADIDDCQLSDAHWLIIDFVRDFYQRYDHSPALRVLIKSLKQELGEDKASSQYLYALFPFGPAKQVSKYAGLPKPKHCI